MLTRIKTSWMLLERSLQVIAEHKKLLIFPIITFIATLGIFLFFFASLLLQPTGHSLTEKAHWQAVGQSIFTPESMNEVTQARSGADRQKHELQLNQTGLVLVAVLYFFSIFLATFFNVAFYHEIIEALNGRSVGLAQGFSFALSRIKMILMWSMFAGLVGYLIKLVERRVGLVGKIIVNLIGLAWSVASVFAIPVIICDPNARNPIEVVKSSAISLKKRWGETVIGYVGFSGITMMVLMGSVLAMVGGFVLSSMLQRPLMIVGVMVSWIFFIFAFTYLSSVAGTVYHCALYLFAADGSIPAGFTSEMMQSAFRQKKK